MPTDHYRAESNPLTSDLGLRHQIGGVTTQLEVGEGLHDLVLRFFNRQRIGSPHQEHRADGDQCPAYWIAEAEIRISVLGKHHL